MIKFLNVYVLLLLEGNPGPTDYAMPFWPCRAFLGSSACWT